MKKTLVDMSVLMGVVPFLTVGILLLAGAGFFAWGAGFLALAAAAAVELSALAGGERLVKYRKEQRSFQVPVQPQQQHDSLALVEMDVSMKFRDRAHDLRVVN